MTFISARFQGQPELEAVSAGNLRLGAAGTPEFPAPVLSEGPAISLVQRALLDLGYGLEESDVIGIFGPKTGAAVTKFKQDWHLSPTDPVVGVGTIGALDRDIEAFDRPDTTPPPLPPSPGSPFGRRPSGLAEVPAALAVVDSFRLGVASKWATLDREIVADGIAKVVVDPDSVQQGGNGLCAAAAFFNVWAQDAPLAYATFATTLFERGRATIGPLEIVASQGLLDADYSAIAQWMVQRRYAVPPQADWMTMSALRDSSNLVFPFTGSPPNQVMNFLFAPSGTTSDELDGWLRATGVWSNIINNTNDFTTRPVSDALTLDARHARCLINVDGAMIERRPLSGRPSHVAVLRSDVVESAAMVTMTVWTWANLYTLQVPVSEFEQAFYGTNIAFE